ncbi:MAG: Hpt domain-containing protein [Chloroflexales bacterium]
MNANNTATRMGHLQTALTQGDAATVNMAAHAIKGASMAFGANTFSALCSTLESLGQAGDLAGAAVIFPQAQAEYERVCVELPAMLTGMLP